MTTAAPTNLCRFRVVVLGLNVGSSCVSLPCVAVHDSLLWAVSSCLEVLVLSMLSSSPTLSLSVLAQSSVASYAQVPSANARVDEYTGAGCAQAYNTYYSLPRGVCVGQFPQLHCTATQRQPQPPATH